MIFFYKMWINRTTVRVRDIGADRVISNVWNGHVSNKTTTGGENFQKPIVENLYREPSVR